MIVMGKKKVLKLKTWPKVLLVLIVLAICGGLYANHKYQEQLYLNSNEYKLGEKGYTEENIEDFKKYLSDKEIKAIIDRDYNEFIPEFIKCKYFLFKNLDKYLTQVVTKDQDFFKYYKNEGYDYENIVVMANVGAINKPYTETTPTDMNQGYAILVNKYNYLAEDYIPDDLVTVDIKYKLGNSKKEIRSEVYDAFLKMWNDAHEQGIYLLILSAFRSYQSQVETYDDYKNKKGESYADSIAARPGFSEHQTGLSLDIYSWECTTQSQFKDSKTFAWLQENSYKYGFIIRYPEGKDKITGYGAESWHYRYLGVDLATKVYESGLTFDEYYAFYLDK